MKRTLHYYFLSIMFAALTALTYTAIYVFIFDHNDPKFGKIGLLYLAIYISSVTSATSSISSTILISFIHNTEKHFIFMCSLFNGMLLGLLYYPVIIYAPIVNGISDWIQYIVYFLILVVITTLISNYVYIYFKKPNNTFKRDAKQHAPLN